MTISVYEVMKMPLYPKVSDITCGSCTHFCRHYVKDRSRYFPLTFGHCVYLRTKDRREDGACPAWRARPQK